MASYAETGRSPRTLTEREQRLLLKVTGELVVGDRLLDARGRPVEIVEITRRQGVFRVYNFEVAGLHTYFVTRQALWSHNRNGDCPPGGGDDAARGGALVVRNPISKHAAERLAERGITGAMARKAIESGTRYYDRLHGTVAHVLEKGMASGKTLHISTNPATGNVTTGIIRRRFNPDVLLPDGTQVSSDRPVRVTRWHASQSTNSSP